MQLRCVVSENTHTIIGNQRKREISKAKIFEGKYGPNLEFIDREEWYDKLTTVP